MYKNTYDNEFTDTDLQEPSYDDEEYIQEELDKRNGITHPRPIVVNTQHQLPTIFNSDMPKVLKDRVKDIAKLTSTPPEYAYTALMIAISSAIGTKMSVYPLQKNDDYFVTATMWGMIVGDPGARKTPVYSQCFKKIDEIDKNIGKAHEVVLKAHNKNVAVLNAKLNKAIKNSNSSDDEIETLTRELEELKENPPIRETYTVNDITPEALHKSMSNSQNGLLYKNDELAGLFKHVDRVDAGGYREQLLSYWNGTLASSIIRVGSGRTDVERNFLSVFGTIQPDKLTELLKKSTDKNTNDGFTARFQMVFFPKIGAFKLHDIPVDEQAKKAIDNVIEYAYHWDGKDEEMAIYNYRSNNDKFKGVSFKSDAQYIFNEWTTKLNNRIRKNENHESSDLMNHLAKYDALMCKIALVYHFIEHTGHNLDTRISELNMLRAISMCEILEQHARHLYPDAMLNYEAEKHLAIGILDNIRIGKFTKPMSESDISRSLFSKKYDKEDTKQELKNALQLLVHNGWLKSDLKEGNHRPSVKYTPVSGIRERLTDKKLYIKEIPVPAPKMEWTDRLHEYLEGIYETE